MNLKQRSTFPLYFSRSLVILEKESQVFME